MKKVLLSLLAMVMALGYCSAQSYADIIPLNGSSIKAANVKKQKGMLSYEDDMGTVRYLPYDTIQEVQYSGGKKEFFINEKYKDKPDVINVNVAVQLQRQQNLKQMLSSTVLFDNIGFESGGIEIPESEYKKIFKVYTFLEKNLETNIVIIGHTDSQGDAKKNMELSKKRAKSVLDFLVEQGIDASRLKSEGRGETQPIFEKDDENRRVEFRVQYEGVAVNYYSDGDLASAKTYITGSNNTIIVTAPINITGNGGTILTDEKIDLQSAQQKAAQKHVPSVKPDSIEYRDIYHYVNAGVGLLKAGAPYKIEGYDNDGRILPFAVSWERTNLSDRWFNADWWTSGGYISYTRNKYRSKTNGDSYPYKVHSIGIGWRNTILGGNLITKIFKKVKFPKNFEFYAGLHLGFNLGISENPENVTTQENSFFDIAPYIGARYYFYKGYGAFVEFGKTAQSWFTVGISTRFQRNIKMQHRSYADNERRNKEGRGLNVGRFFPKLRKAKEVIDVAVAVSDILSDTTLVNRSKTPEYTPREDNLEVQPQNVPQEPTIPVVTSNQNIEIVPEEPAKRKAFGRVVLEGGISQIRSSSGSLSFGYRDESPSMDYIYSDVSVPDKNMGISLQGGLDVTFKSNIMATIKFDYITGKVSSSALELGLGYNFFARKRFYLNPFVTYQFGFAGVKLGEMSQNASYIQVNNTLFYSQKVTIRLKNNFSVIRPQINFGFRLGNRFFINFNGGYSFVLASSKPNLLFLGDDINGKSVTETESLDAGNVYLYLNGTRLTDAIIAKVGGFFGHIGIAISLGKVK